MSNFNVDIFSRSSRRCIPSRSVKFIVFVLLSVCLVDVVCGASCPFCINGKLASGSCDCLCRGGYLGPFCSFRAADAVTIDVAVNRSIDQFQSGLFMDAVSGSCPGVNVSFLYATSVPKFASIVVRITLPGYAVQRLLTSIAFKDAWVGQYKVIGAYPTTPQPQAPAWKYDYILASTPTFVVSVSGVGWLAGAIGLVFVVAFLENCCMRYDEIGVEQMRIDERQRPRAILVSPKPAQVTTSSSPSAIGNPLAAPAPKQREQYQQQQKQPTFERKASVVGVVPPASSGPLVRTSSFAQSGQLTRGSSFVGQQAIQVKPRSRVGT